ncbi:MAG: serine O-acetyltransferase EpsC [Chthoniobacterales bacterium]
MEDIAQQLIASYHESGGINHLDGANLPSKVAIAKICEDLLSLIFPGFHDDAPLLREHVERVTNERVAVVANALKVEICKSLRLGDPNCPDARSEKMVAEFLSALPRVRQILKTDVAAAFEGDPAARGYDEIILSYPFVETIAVQRMAHLFYLAELPIIPRMMTEWAHSRTGIDIHPGARIGSNFFIDHGTGVVIGETSEIGTNVKLYQGVSLIARSLAGGQQLRGKKRHPTIEDNVTIYAGTTIMGGDTVIGAGSTIGANVFLTHGVPKRSLVYFEEKQLNILDKNKRPGLDGGDWSI